MKWKVRVEVMRNGYPRVSGSRITSGLVFTVLVPVDAENLKQAHDTAVGVAVKVADEGYGPGCHGVAVLAEIVEEPAGAVEILLREYLQRPQ